MAAKEREKLTRWKEQDFYGILGVSPTAKTVEVKKGFRQVALTCHPDKVPEEERELATKRFQLIAEAYEVLSNEATRKKYDSVRPPTKKNPWITAATELKKSSNERPKPDVKQSSEAPSPFVQQSSTPEQPESVKSAGFSTSWSHCDICDRRCPNVDLRKCPKCVNKKVCSRCEICTGCIPEDIPAPRRQSKSDHRVPEREPEQFRPCPPNTPAQSPVPKTKNIESWRRVDVESTEEQAGAEVWQRAKPADDLLQQQDETEKNLDMFEILSAMGFEKIDIEKALECCDTVEDAVHYIMMRQNRGVIAHIAEGAERLGVYEVAERVGEHMQPAASGLYEYMQPAASGLYNAVSSWVSWPEASVDVKASLVALGYQENIAEAASRRCSSVEAAIEWISDNPEMAA